MGPSDAELKRVQELHDLVEVFGVYVVILSPMERYQLINLLFKQKNIEAAKEFYNRTAQKYGLEHKCNTKTHY